MLKQICLDYVKPGAVIKAIEVHSDWACIVFDDGTFTTITAGMAYDQPFLDNDRINLDPDVGYVCDRHSESYIELGVHTQEEFDAAVAVQTARDEVTTRKHKLQQYEKLKAELGL